MREDLREGIEQDLLVFAHIAAVRDEEPIGGSAPRRSRRPADGEQIGIGLEPAERRVGIAMSKPAVGEQVEVDFGDALGAGDPQPDPVDALEALDPGGGAPQLKGLDRDDELLPLALARRLEAKIGLLGLGVLVLEPFMLDQPHRLGIVGREASLGKGLRKQRPHRDGRVAILDAKHLSAPPGSPLIVQQPFELADVPALQVVDDQDRIADPEDVTEIALEVPRGRPRRIGP